MAVAQLHWQWLGGTGSGWVAVAVAGWQWMAVDSGYSGCGWQCGSVATVAVCYSGSGYSGSGYSGSGYSGSSVAIAWQ
jgi:hypothetical protein